MLLGNIIDLFQKLYDGGPLIRAIMAQASEIAGKAGQIKTKATSSSLKVPAEHLNSAADTLKGNASVTTARDFKTKYEAFKTAYYADSSEQTKVESHWTALKKIIDEANLTEQNKKIKFWAIIVPSIISQWLNFLTYVLLLVVYETGL